jgi:hypothetical protein
VFDLGHGCIHRLDSIDNEMDKMNAWHPVSHIKGALGREYHGRCWRYCHYITHQELGDI